MGIELNGQQKIGLEKSNHWYKSQCKQVFEISGPAGSGKTSIVYFLIENLGLSHEEVLFMAYVGKATMALARMGNNAKTIHSSIYDVSTTPRVDETGNIVKKNNRILYSPCFKKKTKLPEHIKLLVIDEGSMVNKTIAEDILSYGLPILVLGDLYQLPPVFGNPYFLNKPDVILTEIMRQAKDDPIIHLSSLAREGKKIQIGKYGPKCFVISKDDLTDNLLKNSDIVICGKNETRQNINNYMRNTMYKIDKAYPVKGEKLICRQNNWNMSLDENIFMTNGLIGFVNEVYLNTYDKKSIQIDFRPEFLSDLFFDHVKVDYVNLFRPLTENTGGTRSFYNKFEFAYAISAHLAQGSQYDNILVYDEKLGNRSYYNKWLYTAVTRAREGLILAV